MLWGWPMLTIDIDQGIYKSKSKVVQNEKKICGFSYNKYMANLEGFC